MTREEEIIEAGIEYNMQNSPCCIGGDNFYEQAKEFNRNKSFEAGAKWADSTYVKGNIEKESKLYAQGVVGDISEDIRHLLATAYIAGAKRIER